MNPLKEQLLVEIADLQARLRKAEQALEALEDDREVQGQFEKIEPDSPEIKSSPEVLWSSHERERVRVRELEVILDAVPLPVFISRDPGECVITGNLAACQLLQLPRHANFSFAASGNERPHYQAWQDGRKLRVEELPMQRALAGERVHNFEYDLILADGTVRHVAANAMPLFDLNGNPQGAVGALIDLTERRQAQEELRRARDQLEKRVRERTKDLQVTVNQLQEEVLERLRADEKAAGISRLYRFLSRVNETIVRAHDPEDLFIQTCRIAVDEGGFRLAWIGLLDRDTLLIRPKTFYGLEQDYLKNLAIPVADIPEGRGPTGTAVREGKCNICQDYATDPRMAPWRQEALARGYGSSAAFPIFLGSQVIGAITLYAARAGFFTEGDIELLNSLSLDLSFALESMDREAKRQAAEAKIRRLNLELEERVQKRTAQLAKAIADLEQEMWVRRKTQEDLYRLNEELEQRIKARTADLQESRERLHFLAAQILNSQEQERKRLAAELHDELGHALLTLKLSLAVISRKLYPEQENVRELLQEQLDYVDNVIEDVRRLYHDLSPGNLEDLGLVKALASLVEGFSAHLQDVKFELDLSALEGHFSLPVQTIIYRLVQEALTNIGKHAEPTRVSLSARLEDRHVCLVIEDNGRGFDLSEIERDPDRGLGLAAMRERLYFLNGSFEVASRIGQGTKLTFIIPTL